MLSLVVTYMCQLTKSEGSEKITFYRKLNRAIVKSERSSGTINLQTAVKDLFLFFILFLLAEMREMVQ